MPNHPYEVHTFMFPSYSRKPGTGRGKTFKNAKGVKSGVHHFAWEEKGQNHGLGGCSNDSRGHSRTIHRHPPVWGGWEPGEKWVVLREMANFGRQTWGELGKLNSDYGECLLKGYRTAGELVRVTLSHSLIGVGRGHRIGRMGLRVGIH